MGSTYVCYKREGYDINDVFNELKEEYIEDYGNSGYTGTIASCVFGGCYRKFDGLINEDRELLVKSLIHNDDVLDLMCKGELFGIDMGIVSYESLVVKKKSFKNTPKYELRYVVHSGDNNDKILFSDKNKKICEDKMLELALRYENCYVSKEYILVEGSSLISEPLITKKSSSVRPTKGTYKELHKYVFFGWAPE